MLKQKILNRESGIITYGITPPKKNNTEEKIKEISQKHKHSQFSPQWHSKHYVYPQNAPEVFRT